MTCQVFSQKNFAKNKSCPFCPFDMWYNGNIEIYADAPKRCVFLCNLCKLNNIHKLNKLHKLCNIHKGDVKMCKYCEINREEISEPIAMQGEAEVALRRDENGKLELILRNGDDMQSITNLNRCPMCKEVGD